MTSKKNDDVIAVVLLHGIGEQRPMETLRGFVNGIFDEPGRSKPDRLSELFDVRRLNVRFGGRDVHCYELYWAHLMHGSEVIHIVKWLKQLVFMPAAELRKMAIHLGGSRYVYIRRAVFGLLFLLATLVVTVMYMLHTSIMSESGWVALVAFLITAVMALALWWLKDVLVTIVGDAARYLDSAPPNVGVRQEIRKGCVQFLDDLTKSNRPSYSRIVVIGHSLGSVIAYDSLKLLWARMDGHAALTALSKGEKEGHHNEELVAWLHGGPHPERESASSPQRAMFEKVVFDEKTGWKISDLITVGSPLTHAPLLFAESVEDFYRLKEQRELPTCPPQPDDDSPYCSAYRDTKTQRLEFHHAAPFAVVQWTNCYFPSDPVGGPLGPIFGCGIQDVELPLPVLNKPHWLDHIRYWSDGSGPGSASFREEVRGLLKPRNGS